MPAPQYSVLLAGGAGAGALVTALEAAGMRVRAVSTRADVAEASATDRWDVAVVEDALADGTDGLALVGDLGARPPGVRAILLSDTGDARRVLDAWRAGAADVVAPRGPAEIVSAVLRVATLRGPALAPSDDEVRFRTLADSMPQLVWMARADGVVEYYNARWREYEGIAPMERGWRWAPVLHPDDREATEAAWRRAVETGAVYEVEHRVLGADGTYRWHVSRGVPHLDADGRVRMWYGTATNIDALKQAQADVARSEERLRLAAESARMFAFEWDPRTDEVLRSAECLPILGERERDTGREFFGRVHPDDREGFLRVIHGLTPAEPHYHAEYRVRRSGGSVVFLEESARGLFDADGRLVRLVGMTSDVSRRREAEHQLRETTAILRAVAESTPDGIYVKDREGRFVFANPATLRYIGLPPEQVLGRTELEVHGADPVEAAAIMATDERIMASGVVETVEEPFRGPEGPRTFLSTKSPLRDDKARISGIVGISSDITGRKRAEQALRDSEQRLTIATDAAGLGVFEWDVTGSTLQWQNPRLFEIFGRERAPVPIGYPELMDRLHPDDVATFGRVIDEASRGGDLRLSFRLRRDDGAWRWLEMSGRSGREQDGSVRRLVGVISDVTARVEQERERQELLDREQAARRDAERASLLKDQFLATLSHELRTPLNAVLGWAQLLAMRPVDDHERLVQILQTIARNAQLQVRLIEDLLDMSRIMSGKIRIERRPTPVVSVLDAAVESVAPAVEAKQLTMAVRVEAEACRDVMADPERLQQVISNLLANAAKFTDRGGAIEVHAGLDRDALAITVSDSGQGIAPEFLPFVFERFRQADGSTTRAHGGLGLGLSIARHLVELHGGTIEAHSDGAGRGARFRVRLPLAGTAAGSPAPPSPPPLSEGERGRSEGVRLPPGARILVVDDHEDARDLAATALREHGAAASAAASVKDAFAALASGAFDAVVVDIGMPGRDGYDFIRTLRASALEAHRRLPALALTSFAHSEDRARALGAGFDAHVAKPVSPQHLASVVSGLLRRRSEHQR